MGRKSKEKQKREWIIRITIVAIITVALLISLFFSKEISRALGLIKENETEYSGLKTEEVLSSTVGDNLNVHFVDVGQGDACIVELPDDKVMLIDGGGDSGKTQLLNYIDKNIKREDGTFKYFDYAILTHADEDHCGGIDDVLSKYPAKVFYRPNELASKSGFVDPGKSKLIPGYGNHNTAAYAKAITEGYNEDKSEGIVTEVRVSDANNDKINKITPENLTESDAEFYSLTFYSPLQPSYTDRNDYSPIMILEYQGFKFALSGDAEKQAEADFVAAVASGKFPVFDSKFTVDVIKLGHHGSSTSNTEAYLNAMTTEQSTKDTKIVISCGKDNKYKHPHDAVLKRLDKLGFSEENILRTDMNRDLAFSVKGELKDGVPSYELFFGANVVVVDKAAVSLGVVDITYKEIVFTIIAALVLYIIISPIVRTYKRRASKQASAQRKRK